MATNQNIETMWLPKSNGKLSPNQQLRNLISQLSFEHQTDEEKQIPEQRPKKDKKKKRKTKRRKSYLIFGTRVNSDDSDVFFDAYDNNLPSETLSMVLSDVTVNSRHDHVELCLGDSSSNSSSDDDAVLSVAPPAPPEELPLRFLRAGKNNHAVGTQRYQQTLAVRKQDKIDTILFEGNTQFDVIKQYYPHYFHGFGKLGQPCFYEQPPKTNLSALRNHGVTLASLLRHYKFVTEFQWQYLCPDDMQKSIYVIDLNGIRVTDFMGEAVDFMKQAASFSSQHYPERAGLVYVVNVPSWFKMIWNAVKPIVDEDTLQKIFILKTPEEVYDKLSHHIDVENIPKDYGGKSVALGESDEEVKFAELVEHNNRKIRNGGHCEHVNCEWCQWAPVRSY